MVESKESNQEQQKQSAGQAILDFSDKCPVVSIPQEAYISVIQRYEYPKFIVCDELLWFINRYIQDYNFFRPKSECIPCLADTRAIRILKGELLDLGYPLGSDSGKGYYWIPKPAVDLDGNYRSKGANISASQHYKKGNKHFMRGNQTHKNIKTYYNLPAPIAGPLAKLWDEGEGK